MAHRRHRLLLRSLRNGSGTYLVIAVVLMSALAIDLGRERGSWPLQHVMMQEAADGDRLGALEADDVQDNTGGLAAETKMAAVAHQAAGAGDDVVGSVRRKRVRKAWLKHRAKAAAIAKKEKLHAMFRQDAKDQKAGKHALQGIASFYSYDTQTASGEKFDPRALVAAHRTLPFGTWIRVTDLDTEQSVTVRVNDRGPYVDGRIVDLTSGAAASLGISKRGLAKVKIDVVEAPANPVRVAQSSEFHAASCVAEPPAKLQLLVLLPQRLAGRTEATQ
jgi:peptidoglycan lytic transglycosylase